MMFRIRLLIIFLAATASPASAATYYVDADAAGPGDGSLTHPFSTLQAAAEKAQAGDICRIRGGIYRETVRPAHSGTAARPIVFEVMGDTPVVVSGCEPVSGWSPVDDGVYKAPVELKLEERNQIFADGRMMFEARWPNTGGVDERFLLEFEMAEMEKGTEPTQIVDEALPELSLAGGSVWVSSHKRWMCWTGEVRRSGKGFLEVENNSDEKGNHVCKPGGKYYVFGTRELLDTENEWYYGEKEKQLYVQVPGGGEPASRVEAKARMLAFDLTGREHITLRGIRIFASAIDTDEASRGIVLDGLQARYVHHSNRAQGGYGSQTATGIMLRGEGHTMTGCEIAYSSGNCVSLFGRNCRVINNYIHDGDYIGSYAAPLLFGRGANRNVVSHNTIARAGRTTINTSGFYDSLLQYNDVAYSGYLTNDLGLTYANGVEGGNSEVRYNWFHDNVAASHNMGLYFDHGCKNLIFHHNVIWNVEYAGMINNQYGNYLLYFHNTVADANPSYNSTWAAAQDKDLYACRIFNNVGTAGIRVKAQGVESGSNTWNYQGLVDHRYLSPGSEPVDAGIAIETLTGKIVGEGPDRGAYELGIEPWKAGHDFANPPAEIPLERCRPPHRNLLENAAFYQGDLEPWKLEGSQIRVAVDFHSQWVTDGKAMMGGYSVELGAGRNRVSQTVHALKPQSEYEWMAMLRVPEGESVRLGVEGHGAEPVYGEPVRTGAPQWTRRILRFKTGPNETSATVFFEKTSSGSGAVYVDDPGLRLAP